MFIPYFIVLVVVAGVILVLMNIRLLATSQKRTIPQQEEASEASARSTGEPPAAPPVGPNSKTETVAAGSERRSDMPVGTAQGARATEAGEQPGEGDRVYRAAIRHEALAARDTQPSAESPSAPAKQSDPDYPDGDYRSVLRGMNKSR